MSNINDPMNDSDKLKSSKEWLISKLMELKGIVSDSFYEENLAIELERYHEREKEYLKLIRGIRPVSDREKLEYSDEELTGKYDQFKKAVLDLPYDENLVKEQEKYYLKMAKFSLMYDKLRRTTVINEDKKPEVKSNLAISNHIGSLDQFDLTKAFGYEPYHYFIKPKVMTWPFRWNVIYKPTGVVICDPDNLKSWISTMYQAGQLMLHGKKVFMFPEMGRRGPNNMGDFASGVAQLAQYFNEPVDIYAIKNTELLIPLDKNEGSLIPFVRKPIVAYGDTITVGSRENLKDATMRIQQSVRDAYADILFYEEKGYEKSR